MTAEAGSPSLTTIIDSLREVFVHVGSDTPTSIGECPDCRQTVDKAISALEALEASSASDLKELRARIAKMDYYGTVGTNLLLLKSKVLAEIDARLEGKKGEREKQ
jgi:hypothetical protein